MESIITDTILDKAVNKFLTREFNKLKEVKKVMFPDSIFYVNDNGDIISMVHKTPHTKAIFIDWSLWTTIFTLFSFEYASDQQESISKWANQYFGFENSLVDFFDGIDYM